MNAKVTGKIRVECTDGEVNETEINGRAVFLVQIAANKEDLQEDKEVIDVALLRATNSSEFIERISEAVIAMLEHMAKEKVPAGVLYYKLIDEIVKHITEKAGNQDMEMIRTLMGD